MAVTGSAQARFNAAELAKAGVLAMGGQGEPAAVPTSPRAARRTGAKADEGLACGLAALAG